jgi:hypothetical protein
MQIKRNGSQPATLMTHIAIQEALDGRVVDGMERGSDAQYLAGPANLG